MMMVSQKRRAKIRSEAYIVYSKLTRNSWLFWRLLAVSLLLLLVSNGCNNAFSEEETSVSIIDANIPPTFKLSGSGGLMRFIVSGPYSQLDELESTSAKMKPENWELSPEGYAGKEVSKLPAITYGIIPAGFIQIIPKEGSPLKLEEGKFYAIAMPSVNANYRRFCFSINNGKAVRASCSEK